MQFRTIIVEDDELLAEQLYTLLTNNCFEIKIIGIAHSPLTAAEMIIELAPDLVFMDIEMPEMNAFELLDKLMSKQFDIIFTTAYVHYALQAFDHNAIHYLIKPITQENIKRAVQKYIQKKQENYKQQITEILRIMKNEDHSSKRIHLPGMNGFSIVPISRIIRFEADGRYTKVFMKDDKNNPSFKKIELLSINIKVFEDQLMNCNFFRCHHSHLINLSNVKRYIKGGGGILEMENGEKVPVSKRRKDDLLKCLQ